MIQCWGDSLTAGAGISSYKFAYPYVLREYFISYPYRIKEFFNVENRGVGGQTSTQIAARFLDEPTHPNNYHIIWVGRNNYTNPNTVRNDIASMIHAISGGKYLILSILNGNYSGEHIGEPGYNILVQLNNDLQNLYGDNYLDIRKILVNSYDINIPQDIIDFNNDLVPSSLRVDSLHLNNAGYGIVANSVYDKIIDLKWTNDFLEPKNLLYSKILTKGNIYTDGLLIGHGITVTTNADTTAIVELLIGDQLIDKVSLGAIETKLFGDYLQDRVFRISCLSGTLTIEKNISTDSDDGRVQLTGAVTNNGSTTYLGNFTLSQMNTALDTVLALFPGDNRFIAGAGNNTVTGSNNIGVGPSAQKNITTGSNNIGVGYVAQQSITTGSNNIGVGYNAQYLITTGYNNIGVGYAAQYLITNGSNNIGVGYAAQQSITTGSNNIGVGYNAQYLITTGSNNTGVGPSAQKNITTGSNNTCVGFSAQYNIGAIQTAGSFVVGVSYTIRTIGNTDFTLIGAASNTVGVVFTATGVGVGTGNASPNVNNNTAIGYNAGLGIIHGNGNTIVGANVVGLAPGLLNNIILANGTGAAKAQHDGSDWLLTGKVVGTSTMRTAGYTVATLPAGTLGDTAYVTDALAPTYLGAVTGGGAVNVPVFYNGSAWVAS